MTGLLLFLTAVLGFWVTLNAGSEMGASVALVVGGVLLIALVLGGCARFGMWL